jgi:hypothetical protein
LRNGIGKKKPNNKRKIYNPSEEKSLENYVLEL